MYYAIRFMRMMMMMDRRHNTPCFYTGQYYDCYYYYYYHYHILFHEFKFPVCPSATLQHDNRPHSQSWSVLNGARLFQVQDQFINIMIAVEFLVRCTPKSCHYYLHGFLSEKIIIHELHEGICACTRGQDDRNRIN